MVQKRLPAIKTDIQSLVSGEYVAQEGFNPNYVVKNDGSKVSRVRVMANVVNNFVSPSGKVASLTLDDGTETIRAKTFTELSMLEKLQLGDMVDVVGKVKMYNEELFVNIDNVFKVGDPNKEILRKVELLKPSSSQEKPVQQGIPKEDVIKLMDELDNGEGVEYTDIIKELDDEKRVEQIINELLEEGTCFEPRPGKIKKL